MNNAPGWVQAIGIGSLLFVIRVVGSLANGPQEVYVAGAITEFVLYITIPLAVWGIARVVRSLHPQAEENDR